MQTDFESAENSSPKLYTIFLKIQKLAEGAKWLWRVELTNIYVHTRAVSHGQLIIYILNRLFHKNSVQNNYPFFKTSFVIPKDQ